MKNKKLLAFALSMAVAAGCTACGGGQASTDTSAAGSSDSTQAESSATGDNTVIVGSRLCLRKVPTADRKCLL